jgi:hypothetical protein
MCYAFFFVTTTYVMAKTTTLVNWTNSYARRTIGGINLVDLKEGLNALLNKWILLVLELGESNLKNPVTSQDEPMQTIHTQKMGPKYPLDHNTRLFTFHMI